MSFNEFTLNQNENCENVLRRIVQMEFYQTKGSLNQLLNLFLCKGYWRSDDLQNPWQNVFHSQTVETSTSEICDKVMGPCQTCTII
jgi:hypothetical protein